LALVRPPKAGVGGEGVVEKELGPVLWLESSGRALLPAMGSDRRGKSTAPEEKGTDRKRACRCGRDRSCL
jgi:hypothetical protein